VTMALCAYGGRPEMQRTALVRAAKTRRFYQQKRVHLPAAPGGVVVAVRILGSFCNSIKT